jgi:CheY-like chemotaxis protein
MAEAVTRLKREKFELAVIDSHFQDLANTCYRINCIWNTPLGLLTGKEESGWDNLRFLDIDGYVPVDSNRTDLYAHFDEISRRGRIADEVKRNINVLVIGDDKRNQKAIEQAFQFYWKEARVTYTDNGDEALRTVLGQPLDVILLDIDLRDKPALEVLENIRAFSQTPVMVLMEDKDGDNVINAMRAGATDYMEKYFRPVTLITRVRQTIRQTTGLGKRALPDRMSHN